MLSKSVPRLRVELYADNIHQSPSAFKCMHNPLLCTLWEIWL